MSAPPQNPWAEPLTKPIDELRTYLCNVPDFIEGSKRLEIRPTHLEQSKAGREVGWILQAGATFSDDTRTKMTGSWYLLREESVDKARERLSRDVYAKGGAWDMSRVTITAVAVSGSKP
ncbi:YciI family protein [Rhodotorula paludigena]|uniref:YciI family protein n=1 Tax=Rhodotorula paludigena TaxID=86838 RepID=UPI0031725D3C